MKGTFKRSFFFFIIVLNLAVVALYSQISTNTDFQQPASKQLSELLSGKSANVDEIILSLPETDLPAALGVAEQLSFKALHNDIPMSSEAVARVRQTIESRLQKAKSVSLQSSEKCPVSVPARRISVSGTEIAVPSYFVTDQPIIISQTPTGEAGTFFPTISVTVAVPPGAKLHSVFLLNGKPFPLKQESSTRLIYRPNPSAENALSIGTHTAQITVTDARGRTASATWSFTVGIKPTAQPAIDPSWPVVGSFSIPLSHLIGNSAVSGNVQIIVYQTPEGKTIQKLVVTGGKGAGELTTQDPFWLGAIFNRRSDDPITISPKTSLAFPGNSIVFTYSYSGIGTVAKEEWVIQEGSSVRKSRDAGVSWTMGKVPVRAIIYLTITVADANGDPSEAYANEGKGINPVLPSGLFGPWRFMSISEMATGSVRFSVQPGILIGDHSHLLIREDPLVLGNHLVFIEDAHVEQVGGNAHPTFEDSAATETNLLFSQPGWAEFRHVMRLRLVCGDETYKTTFEPDSYPLIGHFQASATIKFSKLPPGIIAGTQRKANVSEVALTMNKESKTFSSPTLADPWVLARSTTKPNSTPLAVSGLHIVIPENNIALPFDDFSVVLDPQFNEEHPSEFFFTPSIRPVTAGIDSDIRSISTRKTWTVPLYSEEALLETAFEPGEELTILENQNIDFTTVVKPVPGKGTGELKAGAGEIDLLEGYKLKKLEMLVWGQAHESEMPAEELKKPKQKNDVHWSYSFKPDKGTGTYFIGNGCYAMAYEPETDSEGIVSGGGQRTVTVIPGLKILSPKANFAYPQDTDITVKTTFDNSLAEWNKIKWFIGSSEVHPTPAAPGWSLKLPPGKHTLKAMYSPPNTPPVIESVTFQVVPISLKLTPDRKITALPGSSTVPLKLTLSVNEVEIAKPGEEFNWLSTDFKAIASVSWSVFTAPDDIADFNLTKPYEPKIIFSDKPTAVTTLATVTLHISSPAHPETVYDLTLPIARADVWGVNHTLSSSQSHFPSEAIQNAHRSFALQQLSVAINGKQYEWSAPTSPVMSADSEANSFPIIIQPALSGGQPVTCSAPEINWSGPEIPSEDDYVITPFFRDSSQVSLAVHLVYDTGDSFPLLTKKSFVKAWPLGSLVQSDVDPASFTVPFSGEKLLRYYISPAGSHQQLDEVLLFNKAFSASISSVEWRKSGNHIGAGNPHSYNQSNGTGTVEAVAKILIAEQDFQPPAPSSEASLSATTQATDRPLTDIKIRLQGDNENLEKFVSGYRKVTTYFKAIGFSGREEIGPVSVNWSLSGGDVPADSMRSKILALYNVKSGKVGAINGSYSELLESPVASFTSFFTTNGSPIPLTLFASKGDVEASITISIKQPTLNVVVRIVDGAGKPDILPFWMKDASATWGIENLIQVNFANNTPATVVNATYPPLDMEESSEHKLPPYDMPRYVDLLTPIVYDRVADKFYKRSIILTRQFENLLSAKPIRINQCMVYMVKRLYHDLELPIYSPIPSTQYPGFTSTPDDLYKRQIDEERVSIESQSGIVLKNQLPTSNGFSDEQKLRLAHEIGHILIQNGDEHNDHTGTEWPITNLMNPFPNNKDLTANQFIDALHYDREPSYFISEE